MNELYYNCALLIYKAIRIIMQITIYSTTWCPSCVSAKKLLDSKGLPYEEINIEEENMSREKLSEITGGHTVPQIVINKKTIGGFEHLMMFNQSGELDKIISNEN